MSINRSISAFIPIQKELIIRQIRNCYAEIIFKNFVFAAITVGSLFYIYQIKCKLDISSLTVDKYVELTKAIAALFTPFVTYVAQGYIFPRARKLNVLRFFLLLDNLIEEELDKKILYDE